MRKAHRQEGADRGFPLLRGKTIARRGAQPVVPKPKPEKKASRTGLAFV